MTAKPHVDLVCINSDRSVCSDHFVTSIYYPCSQRKIHKKLVINLIYYPAVSIRVQKKKILSLTYSV